jgi:hypothetical protein
MTAPLNRLNLLQGPMKLYIAKWTAVDDEPDNPVSLATTPAAPFDYMGATRGGVNLLIEQTYTIMEVDQVVGPADVRLTSEVVRLAATLAEPTLANLSRILNSGAVAAGAFTPRGSDALANAIPSNYKVIADGLAPGGVNLRRRVILRRAVNTEGVGLMGAKADAAGLSASMLALYVDGDAPYDVEDAVPA